MKFNMRYLLPLALLVRVSLMPCFGFWRHEADELDRLILRGLQNNPRLQRFWRDVEQADSEHAALDGFWDPVMVSRAAHARGLDGEDRAWLETGATSPLPLGGYLDATLSGGSIRALPGNEDERLYQTLAAVDWRIPLWRDRGFREWRFRDQRGDAVYQAAYGRWVAEAQALRRDISLAYIAVLESRALMQVAVSSRQRAEQLLDDAEALAALEAIPEYQVAAARLEAILRREEEVATRQMIDAEKWRLKQLLGMEPPASLAVSARPEDLLNWARQAPAFTALSLQEDMQSERRGDHRENIALQRGAQAGYDLATERRRSDLSLQIQAVYHGEDPDRWPATSARRRDRNFGWETALVWSRPWRNVRERAEIAGQRALLSGFRERQRELEQENRTRLEIAGDKYRATSERLQLVDRAVAAAEKALAAESERFQLGESRSRDVLDAQKDLTDTMQRRNLMAAELLRAAVELHYSLGFSRVAKTDGDTTP